MKINIEQPIPEAMENERCFFKCDEPKGSAIAGILVMVLGIVFVPIIVQLLEGTLPLTLDGFLMALYVEFSRVLQYIVTPTTTDFMFYALFSLIAGVVTIKVLKGILVSIIFLAIVLVGFFFLALFYFGIVIDYTLLFSNMFNVLLAFAVTIFLPCVVGTFISYVITTRKKCFVMGKGTTLKS